MIAGEKKFVVDQGATWEPVLSYKTPSGDPVDLTGWSVRMQARETYDSPEPFIDISTEVGGITTDPAAGKIMLCLPAEQTAAITVLSGVYDIEIYSGATVHKLLRGIITIRREATK